MHGGTCFSSASACAWRLWMWRKCGGACVGLGGGACCHCCCWCCTPCRHCLGWLRCWSFCGPTRITTKPFGIQPGVGCAGIGCTDGCILAAAGAWVLAGTLRLPPRALRLAAFCRAAIMLRAPTAPIAPLSIGTADCGAVCGTMSVHGLFSRLLPVDWGAVARLWALTSALAIAWCMAPSSETKSERVEPPWMYAG